MYVSILLRELKFPQQTKYTVIVSYQDVAELLAARNDWNVSTEEVVINEEVVVSDNSESFSSTRTKCDVGIQCCLQPQSLKSTAIQTEFEDVAMSTRVSTKSPPPTHANATVKVSLNLAHFIYFIFVLIYGKTFLHSMLVLHCCGVNP